MKLEENQLIQALIALKWISKEAIPLLSAKMYENEKSVVGKLRAHGLSSGAILEGAMFANINAEYPLLVVDLACLNLAQVITIGTPLTVSQMNDYFLAPIGMIEGRLKIAVADIETVTLLKRIHFPAPVDYWLADSQQIQILIAQIAGMRELAEKAETEVKAKEAKEREIQSSVENKNNFIDQDNVDNNLIEDTKENATEDDITVVDSLEEYLVEENNHVETNLIVDDYRNEYDRQEIEEITEKIALPIDDGYSVEIDALADDYPIGDEEDPGKEARDFSDQCADEDLISGITVTSTKIAPTTEEYAVENAGLIESNIDSTVKDDSLGSSSFNPNVSVINTKPMDLSPEESAELASDDLVGYLNFVLLDAVTQKASDIHFEPYESHYRIRFRIDGLLQEAYQVPEKYRERIASRLKVMAELDIAEKRLPQDGHLTIQLDEDDATGESVDARISVIPTIWGEKVVLRLLDSNEVALTLNQLGLSNHDRQVVQAAIERSQGLILVTGPTGSGKTVTLYAALNALNQASRNIATIEDPVEINLEGINQLQIHPEIGLDFAEALRAFLRQDPDVVMVGEIRDYKTADIVVKAAQTGHLVLSTLHTNSAIETLNRLKNMRIELYNIASTVKLIIAQRLVRTLCHCKEEDIVDSHYLESLGFTPKQAASRFFRAKGCSECRDGYKGRRAIFEVMPISKRMEALILEDAGTIEIQRQAEREGIKTLRQAGIEMVLEGVTSLEEVLRVTHD
ncbi:ATPase, T2SS/T4P/T4SS family [Ignatzschineria larvae DSM 13226]|uniref:ATPase, T2SS/T4P/T4SS family n=1 Tax=Ignatzschineria larvae DSM 13226 TaxID=1111732 RepID=A0ABZ3C2U9_9GAMM|nr:ATPase, T2SS/T4P/T4SS family [Ignatzschineria larvae]